jgi:ribonuclease D
MTNPIINFYVGDLPDTLKLSNSIAIDTETTGLDYRNNRLCLVQFCTSNGICYLVKIVSSIIPKNIISILENSNILKIFHFARFDLAMFVKTYSIRCSNIYCTKIASKLVRTYTDRHSLKDLCKDCLKADIIKNEQISDWGTESLTDSQKLYAATDVFYLHKLKSHLDLLLNRENRSDIAKASFDFLPFRAELDLLGFEYPDLFRH